MKKNDFFEEVKMTKKIYTIEKIKLLTQDIFKKHGIEKAYLFGSYARGEATKNSDIDIMIRKGKLRTLLQLSALGNDLTSALRKEVDIITEESFTEGYDRYESDDVKAANQYFYNQVLKDRVIIYDELICNTVIEKTEDESDLKCYKKAIKKFKKNPKTFSLEEVKMELNL